MAPKRLFLTRGSHGALTLYYGYRIDIHLHSNGSHWISTRDRTRGRYIFCSAFFFMHTQGLQLKKGELVPIDLPTITATGPIERGEG